MQPARLAAAVGPVLDSRWGSGSLRVTLYTSPTAFPTGPLTYVTTTPGDIRTDYTEIHGVYGGFSFIAVPAHTHVVAQVWVDSRTPFGVIGANPGSTSAPSWTSDCVSSTPQPLSPGLVLPWTLTIVPLSRQDLADQVTINLSPDDYYWVNNGVLTSLQQQTLNGGLNDVINHLTELNGKHGSNVLEYLITYAQLLQQTG